MAYTQAELDALKEAIATGALTVRHGDKSITYKSTAEMLAAVERIKRELASPKRRSFGTAACKTGY